MLNHNSFSSQDTISLFLTFCQSMKLGFLERCLEVFMKFCQALIARICQNAQVFGEVATIVLEQLKIMLAAITKSCENNVGTFALSNYLRFLGMPLLFAIVLSFLTFFG